MIHFKWYNSLDLPVVLFQFFGVITIERKTFVLLHYIVYNQHSGAVSPGAFSESNADVIQLIWNVGRRK